MILSKNFITVVFVTTLIGIPKLIANSCIADLSSIQKDFCISDVNVAALNATPEVPLKYKWNISSGSFDLQFKSCLAAKKNQKLPQNILIAIDRSNTLAVVDSENFQKPSRTIELAKKIIEQIRNDASSLQTSVNVGIMMFSGSSDCKVYNGAAINSDNLFPCLYTPMKPIALAAHTSYLSGFLAAADKKYSAQNDLHGSNFNLMAQVLENTITDISDSTAVLLFTDGKIYNGTDSEDFAYLKSTNYLSAQADLTDGFEKNFKTPFGLNVALMGQIYNTYDSQFKSSYENYCALNPTSDDCVAPVIQSNPSTWPVNGVNVKQYLEKLAMKTGKTSASVVTIDRLNNEIATSNIFSQLKDAGEMLLNASIVKPNGEVFKSQFVDGVILFKGLKIAESEHLDIQFDDPDSPDQTIVPLDLTFTEMNKVDEDNSTPDEMLCQASKKSSKGKNFFEKLTCGTLATKSNSYPSYFFYFFVLIFPLLSSILKRYVRSK